MRNRRSGTQVIRNINQRVAAIFAGVAAAIMIGATLATRLSFPLVGNRAPVRTGVIAGLSSISTVAALQVGQTARTSPAPTTSRVDPSTAVSQSTNATIAANQSGTSTTTSSTPAQTSQQPVSPLW